MSIQFELPELLRAIADRPDLIDVASRAINHDRLRLSQRGKRSPSQGTEIRTALRAIANRLDNRAADAGVDGG